MFPFCKMARNALSFLVADFGFSESEAHPRSLRYTKGAVEVIVYHEDWTNEIGMRIAGFGGKYSIGEVVSLTDPELGSEIRDVMTQKEAIAQAALEKFSGLLKAYGKDALAEKSEAFAVLEAKQQQRVSAFALDVVVQQIRPKAEEAFRKKDYRTAADFYSRIKEGLSPTDLKKLAYAEKHQKK